MKLSEVLRVLEARRDGSLVADNSLNDVLIELALHICDLENKMRRLTDPITTASSAKPDDNQTFDLKYENGKWTARVSEGYQAGETKAPRRWTGRGKTKAEAIVDLGNILKLSL